MLVAFTRSIRIPQSADLYLSQSASIDSSPAETWRKSRHAVALAAHRRVRRFGPGDGRGEGANPCALCISTCTSRMYCRDASTDTSIRPGSLQSASECSRGHRVTDGACGTVMTLIACETGVRRY